MALVERLRKKLAAVNYPTPAQFDPTDSHQIRNFIVWLEDRIIRALPIEKRFRDIESTGWSQYIEKSPNKSAPELHAPKTTGSDAFGNVDVNGPEFCDGVKKLAKLLSIPHHPDITQMFKAACILINEKLSKGSIEKSIDDYGRVKIDELKTPEVCLGFEVQDKDVRAAAVALRLLNVGEMRRLQDEANFAIVQVQRLTADPKTDERLGQVGF
ncbi:Mitochondrial carnitine:acylcarnitine carrier [Fasciola hepatica]|uniref:Mitochondrial carnitine:acylcarnitine carrier n=1 Tax=Fasciola hepatica TaxID=6192 RepID=A0A4E0R554_FASHE|nr:Mitochondrial carnitine:acylcarnitine carrier [Fasciola hepatica]